MTNQLFFYLLESGLCLAAFSLVYRVVLSRSTHFFWMRFYLMASLGLSCVLPLIPEPALWYSPWFTTPVAVSFPAAFTLDTSLWFAQGASSSAAHTGQPLGIFTLLSYCLLLIYLSGLLYRAYWLAMNLRKIRQLIKRNPKERTADHWIVNLSENVPVFSFLNYLFLNPTSRQLPAYELQQIKQHELVHIQQKHSWDVLFFELAALLFWFHPLLAYLKNRLREVHEYLADASVAGKGKRQKAYAHLLLRLATESKTVPLAAPFSDKQISRRILMLYRSRSIRVEKLLFTLILPVAACLLLLFACMDGDSQQPSPTQQADTDKRSSQVAPSHTEVIGKISWQGNTLYEDQLLNEVLNLKPGDVYNKEMLNKHLSYNPEGKDIASLYMDQGYLFFSIDIEEKPAGAGRVDLLIKVYEGQKVRLGRIIIKGNGEVAEEKILEQIAMQPGEFFNRSQLIKAQQAVAAMGYFEPQQVSINPLPDPAKGTVDIEFVLTPLTDRNFQ